jgi:phosphohistidine phosphatase SixA
MQFVFVRHGHPDYPSHPTPKQKNAARLRQEGVVAARAAGAYLKAQGIQPGLVVTTSAQRTRHTAEVVLEALGSAVKPLVCGGGFTAPKRATPSEQLAKELAEKLDDKINKWTPAGTTPSTVMFVGHEVSQESLVRSFPGRIEIPDDNRAAVIILDKVPGGSWTFDGRYHPGCGKAPH